MGDIHFNEIKFTAHALQRMFKRSISAEEVLQVVRLHEVVEDYPEDEPFPSRLVLGIVDKRPLHVVVAYNSEAGLLVVVTTYEPDAALWENDWRTRKDQ